MYALNKHKIYAIVSTIEAVLNVVFSLFLVNSYGITGVALGTLFSAFLIRVFIMPLFVSKITKISIFKYLNSITPFFLASIITIVFAFYLNFDTNNKNDFLNLCLTSSLLFIIYFTISYFLLRNKFKHLFSIKLFIKQLSDKNN
jgi:O-antigen/teichoic acid export membrane protein